MISELRNLSLSRRAFLGGAAAGAGALVIGVRWAEADAADAWSPSIWLTIAADGAVRIVAHRSEMGTGIRTSLPLVVADELEADWARVEIVQGDGDARYGSQNTDGSRSIRRFFTGMREAGAAARMMLVAAAAKTWGVPAYQCRAELHHVVGPGDRKATYGSLVAAARQQPLPPKDAIALKPPKRWRYIGVDGAGSKAIADEKAIVTGTATFGIDAAIDGMLVAVIARSPVLGGKPRPYDAAAIKKLPGVVDVVELPPFTPPHAFQALGGVAVVARDTWSAIQGRRALTLEWDAPAAHARYDSEAFAKELAATARQAGKSVRKRGDAAASLAGADSRVEAEYHLPHLAHAPMEPPCALARITDDGGVEAWAPTQNPQAAQDTLAAVLGIPKDKIVVHVTLLGGGFGRKSKPDFIVEAALLARQLKRPVKVQWTREDDIRHDYYHSVSALRCEAALKGGAVDGLTIRSVFPSIMSTFAPKDPGYGSSLELGLGLIPLPYDVANLALENGRALAHLRIGWLRSVANVYHAFAIGSFTDELAHALKKDPLAMLLELIGPARKVDPNGEGMANHNHQEPLERYPIDTGRLAAVTRLAAERAGWGRELGPRRGLGIAAHRSFLSYVATVVEVAIDDDGTVHIPRVDMALDCGLVVNPDRVRAQMEGSAVFGASLALHGEITAKDGAVEQSNFHDYPVCRMTDAPQQIRVHVVSSTELPAGVGEPGVPPIAPALCNAIFAATGKRIRRLPIARHDLSG